MSEQERNHRPVARFAPYILVAVNFLGWEVIKRTPVFISPTISQQALRIHGVIAGSMLLIFACVLFARFCLAGKKAFRLYRFEKYLLALLAVDFMALLIGLIRRNTPVFLIGDTYKFSVIPLAYFCTVQTLEARNARKLLLFIVILETAVTMESFGVYMVRLAAGIYERAPEHGISLLAFIFFLTSLASGEKLSRRTRNAYSVLLVIIGITAILSRARTLWVQVMLCPLILLLVERKAIKAMIRPAAIALTLLVISLLGFSAVYRNIARELRQRVTETLELTKSSRQLTPVLSLDRRVVETKSALSRYAESPNFLNFIVGFGNGAEFYAPSAALGMGSRPGYKHHIHNGYVSLFFRMGVVGLASFLLFAFSALKSMYTSARHNDGEMPGPMPKVIFVYLVATLVEFLTIYSFIGDIKWGVLLGIFRSTMPDTVKHENSD
jgi:hypothetical protein